MKRIIVGLIIGACAGIIDLVPMVLQDITLDANLSALSLWIVSGLFIATTELKLHPIAKGILIPLLVFLPNSFLIGWKDPAALIPILIMTILLGAFSGALVHRHLNAE